MTQRIKPYEVLKSYENIPSWRNIFPQLERNISLTGEIYFLSYGKYVTKVTSILRALSSIARQSGNTYIPAYLSI